MLRCCGLAPVTTSLLTTNRRVAITITSHRVVGELKFGPPQHSHQQYLQRETQCGACVVVVVVQCHQRCSSNDNSDAASHTVEHNSVQSQSQQRCLLSTTIHLAVLGLVGAQPHHHRAWPSYSGAWNHNAVASAPSYTVVTDLRRGGH